MSEKFKVTSAQIVVTGSKEKPYFSIEYVQECDGKGFIGFGSYNLNFVFDWLSECFEIVESETPNE